MPRPLARSLVFALALLLLGVSAGWAAPRREAPAATARAPLSSVEALLARGWELLQSVFAADGSFGDPFGNHAPQAQPQPRARGGVLLQSVFAANGSGFDPFGNPQAQPPDPSSDEGSSFDPFGGR
jgi:hypothetical protein